MIANKIRSYKQCCKQNVKNNNWIRHYIMIPQLFQKDIFDISGGQWKEEMSEQLRDITRSGVRILKIDGNRRATLVKEIAHINFTTLACLNLAGNNIESIEGLPRVQMAQVTEITLYENNIISVGAIRKAAWPALQELSIYDNFLGDAKSLTNGCFPQLQTLFVSAPWMKENWAEQCFPAKMQAASLKQFSLQKNRFCFDRSIKRVFQQRWPQVKIR